MGKTVMKQALFRCAAFLLCLVLLPALPLLAKPSLSPAAPFSLSPGTGIPVTFTFSGRRFTALFSEESSVPAEAAVSSLPEFRPGSAAADDASHPPDSAEVPLTLPSHYLVLDSETGEVLQLTPKEYLLGVTAAEMPASYELEALKAQAVAAHSYALWQMGLQLQTPDPDLKGAYLSTDPAHFQAYLSEEERRSLWGDRFNEYEAKVRSAADTAAGLVLTSGGEPVAAAFHALSSGKTEAAETVWGRAEACLLSVSSPWDVESPNLTAETTFTSAEVSAILRAHLESPALSGDPAQWISVLNRSPSGTVTEAEAAGAKVTGGEVREWFNLPSSNFSVVYSGDSFRFTTKGKGHGVGLSQYGANAMAAQGSTFSEILLHYYSGAELTAVQPSEP